MKQAMYEITENTRLTENVYKMVLSGDTCEITRPGQFINIRLEGHFLRRPISVCDCREGSITIIYKVVGGGTEEMSEMKPGERLDILTGLGNGFDTEKSGENPVLVGGGVGVPPMYMLAKRLIAEGKKPIMIMGFNKKEEIFFKSEFEALGARVYVTTADGSDGIKGFVTDALSAAGKYSYTYACGPEPMLRALYEKTETSGEFSFEERMGCGFGACMGCSCRTKYANKRICKDGPVLEKEEIIW